jgi:hypothetical protein
MEILLHFSYTLSIFYTNKVLEPNFEYAVLQFVHLVFKDNTGLLFENMRKNSRLMTSNFFQTKHFHVLFKILIIIHAISQKVKDIFKQFKLLGSLRLEANMIMPKVLFWTFDLKFNYTTSMTSFEDMSLFLLRFS